MLQIVESISVDGRSKERGCNTHPEIHFPSTGNFTAAENRYSSQPHKLTCASSTLAPAPNLWADKADGCRRDIARIPRLVSRLCAKRGITRATFGSRFESGSVHHLSGHSPLIRPAGSAAFPSASVRGFSFSERQTPADRNATRRGLLSR